MNNPVATPVSRRAVLAGAVGTGALLVASPSASWARPGRRHPSDAPGEVVTTLFSDDCTNLAAAGWAGNEPLIGAYITDHARSLGDPPEVPLLPVDEGNYLLYSDILATHHDSPYSITKRLPISGASWALSVRARIDELMVSRDTYSTVRPRGFVIRVTAADVVGTTRRYQLRIHDTNQITCLMASGAEQTVELTDSEPTDFHDWELSFDGLDSLAVYRDGSRVAEFVGVGQILAASNTGIELAANGYDSVSGETRVYLDMIELNITSQTIVVDDARELDDFWSVTPASADAYIADSTGPGSGIETPEIAPGEYLLYAGVGAASMHTEAARSRKPWTVEFAARFASIPTYNPDSTDQGLVLLLHRFRRTYKLVWTADTLTIMDFRGRPQTYDLPTPDPERYDVWRIGTDSTGRLAVSANGTKVAVLDNAGRVGRRGPDTGFTLTVDASESSDAHAEIYLTYIKLIEGSEVPWFRPAVTGVTVLPTSDAAQLDTVVSLHDVDPRWLADGSLSLQWELYADGELTRTESRPVTTLQVQVAVSAVGVSGELVCQASLRRAQSTVATAEQKLWLPESVIMLSPGDVAQGIGGSYLFVAVDQATDSTGKDAAAAGWLVSDYTWDGEQASGVFIESSASAGPLTIPATLAGWCAVSVGCVSGSEAISATIGGQTTTVAISTLAEPDSYGPGAITESYLGAFDLSAAPEVILQPVTDKVSRVAYLRFRSLTTEETALAQEPDEGAAGTRMMIDNDGYSEYAYRNVTTEAKLRARVAEFGGHDVGAISYCLLGTTLTNYNSSVAIGPRESKEWMSPELWSGLLATDRTVIDRLIGLNDAGVVPHATVADEGASYGMETFASLRASGNYSPTYRAGLNGKKYADLYPEYGRENFDGSTSFRLSYAYPEMQSYILDLLVEAGSFPNIAGVMLDLCRYPDVVGWDPPLVSAYQEEYGVDPRLETTVAGIERWLAFRCEPVTSLLREVRAALPAQKVMVRIPRNWYFDYGLDVETWVSEGLIDILVPSAATQENFWTNELADFVDLVAETPVALYGCIEATLQGRDATPLEDELAERGIPVGTTSRKNVDAHGYQLRTHEFYAAGFDGVYLFNNPWGRDALGLLGDKVKIRKWRTFGYPTSLATILVTSTSR
ncbi:family 10 glycosylhydrolase [Occultella gossypii]|uniref:Family 10 glycosylhydrolase n=1 Tax=Occultella gossypii TaxID=2800820 RepID=A0ABS7SI93_9MICO|nr:family 10 glycosylhydrolase [Occultella gossypii]MBZ2198998.1 family 10 glycosylhydrolase [Occultella gossypii]